MLLPTPPFFARSVDCLQLLDEGHRHAPARIGTPIGLREFPTTRPMLRVIDLK